MASRVFVLLVLQAVLASAAAKKTVATATGENQDLRLTVTLHLDPADITEIAGSDLGGHYIVADVKVEPKYGKTVIVDRNDFKMFSEGSSERATPYVPSQIAGRSAIIVTQNDGEGKKSKPSISGGLGGMIGGGRGMPDAPTNKVTGTSSAGGDKETQLEKTLTQKMLPEKKSDQPVTGLLYFPMEKQKMKDLQVLFGDHENRITLRYK